MNRSLAPLYFACLLVLGTTTLSFAQRALPLPPRLPDRSALERLGLTRAWFAQIPVGGPTQVLGMNLTGSTLFVQTNTGGIYALDAETGKQKWSAMMPNPMTASRPVAINERFAFVANMNNLLAYDLTNGAEFFNIRLDSIVASGPTATEARVMVGLRDGRLVNYGINEQRFRWAWQLAGEVTSAPIIAPEITIYGDTAGKVYVTTGSDAKETAYDRPQYLYRFRTGGPILAPIATLGTRTLLVASQDRNLYALDAYEGTRVWTYPSPGSFSLPPLVAGQDIFCVDDLGVAAKLNQRTGQPIWVRDVGRQQFLAVSPTKIYSKNLVGDLIIVSRETGKVLFTANQTHDQAGLDLRLHTLGRGNPHNDRIYVGSPTGQIVAIRETALVQPVALNDPNALPFGYLPPIPQIADPVGGAGSQADDPNDLGGFGFGDGNDFD